MLYSNFLIKGPQNFCSPIISRNLDPPNFFAFKVKNKKSVKKLFLFLGIEQRAAQMISSFEMVIYCSAPPPSKHYRADAIALSAV